MISVDVLSLHNIVEMMCIRWLPSITVIIWSRFITEQQAFVDTINKAEEIWRWACWKQPY